MKSFVIQLKIQSNNNKNKINKDKKQIMKINQKQMNLIKKVIISHR